VVNRRKMDTSGLIRLLHTDHYSPADLEEVNGLCRNYPMFGLAHILRVRIKESLGQEKEKDLKVAAVYSSDRGKLFQIVNEVKRPVVREQVDESGRDSPRIQFSEELHHEADLIIEQHAPYVTPAGEGELLELDDEGHPSRPPAGENTAEEDPVGEDTTGTPEAGEEQPETSEAGEEQPDTSEAGEEQPDTSEAGEEQPDTSEAGEISSETLVGMVVKDDTDMEDPESGSSEVPAIDMIEKRSRLEESKRLISNFIHDEPGPIRADRPTDLKGDVSLNSGMEHDGLITDTLARIYVKQGLYAKAVYAYERLSLKYPEKSAYFAAQIEKIQNINHS